MSCIDMLLIIRLCFWSKEDVIGDFQWCCIHIIGNVMEK